MLKRIEMTKGNKNMSGVQTILGVEVDANDPYKGSVLLARKLAEMVRSDELSETVARNALLENYPGDKYAQSLDVFNRVLSGKKLPSLLLIKRPGESLLKLYWKEQKHVAVVLVMLLAFIIFKEVL
tara:strand:+ start:20461 stop:20838 length:378 start_codon:yes stop_codon:yes gene_type:complete